jgi:hypothetical protein
MRRPEAVEHGLRKVLIKGARLAGVTGYLRFWPAPIRWKSNTYALYYDTEASSAPIERGGPRAFLASDLSQDH